MNGSEVSSVFKLAASTLNLIVYAFILSDVWII